jgi:RNA polymerase sigma-70 factor (ECF subfamily)
MSNESLVQELLTYRAELFGFIRALLRNTHDAEDLFQEVSAVVLREASAGGEPIRDFRAWVKEVARRKALEHYRARRACRAAGLPVEEMAGLVADVYRSHDPAPFDLAEEYDALRACMQQMPEHVLRLVRLRYLGDQEYGAIARSVQRSEAAIRRMVARARLSLMDCVQRRLKPAAGGAGT